VDDADSNQKNASESSKADATNDGANVPNAGTESTIINPFAGGGIAAAAAAAKRNASRKNEASAVIFEDAIVDNFEKN
jgi:hypothetical protein